MRLSPSLATLALATLISGLTGPGTAQTAAKAEIAKQLAPAGTLRVAVLMLSYFANEFCREFVADVKASGFVQKAIDRMGSKADGVVVLTP
jgi:hypothetical protein